MAIAEPTAPGGAVAKAAARPQRLSLALSLLAVVALCAAYAWLPSSAAWNIKSLVLSVVVSTVFFGVFRYPLAFDPEASPGRNLAAWVCHAALAIGFAFFFYLADDAGGTKLLLGKDGILSMVGKVLVIGVPLAVGVFAYFFLNVALRFDGIGRHLEIMALGAVAGAVLVAGFVGVKPTSGFYWFYLSTAYVMFAGMVMSGVALLAVAGEVVLKAIVFDAIIITLLSVLMFAITGLATLASGRTVSGALGAQMVLALAFMIVCGLLEAIVWLIVRVRRALKPGSGGAAPSGNRDEPSIIMFALGRMVGLITNFSVFLFPFALLYHWRLARFFDHRLNGKYGLDPQRRKLVRQVAIGAAICQAFLFSAPCIGAVFWSAGQGSTLAAPWVRAICFAVAGGVAWLSLRDLSKLYAPGARP